MSRFGSASRRQDGFTLIEIMVVILILGLLATLVVQSIRGATDKARRTKAMADIRGLETALDRYYLDHARYPSTEQGLAALLSSSESSRVSTDFGAGEYIRSLPPDPWGHPYVYESDGNHYTLGSYGADGVEGGTGRNADIGEGF